MENPFDDFFNYEPRKDLENFSKVPTEVWLKIGEQKALENFQLAAKAVPAYRDFLKKHKVNPEKIKTIEDFKQLPLTTKENYFKVYPLKDIVMGGDLSKATVIHSTSGSTGNLFYYPKSAIQDINSYKGVELFFVYYFDIDKVNTLFLNSLAMGPWPAGEIMHSAIKMSAEKGRKISVISPGLHIDLAINFFEDMASNFEQVIVGGYPAFLRDFICEGLKRKINFKKVNTKFLTGGEKFTENWRSLLIKSVGSHQPHKMVCSVYGLGETGVISLSTPFVDGFRISLAQNPKLISKLFTRKDLPSFTQFIPPAKHIEIKNDEIVVTSPGIAPVIRYNTKDYGKILTPQEVLSAMPKGFKDKYGFSSEACGILNLPILSIYGRSDGTITLYALNIYPEHIAQALESPKAEKYLTGRAIVEKLETVKSEPYFKLKLELKSGFSPSERLGKLLQKIITAELAKLSSEYMHLFSSYGSKVEPVIELKEYGSSDVIAQSGKGIVIRK